MVKLKLKDVNKIYETQKGDVHAVKNTNLSIDEEEFFAVLGPSGCGKTSLLRMISGLIEVSNGTIEIGGKDITNIPAEERNVAMSFETYSLYPNLTVYENIAFPLHAANLNKEIIKKQVNEMARLLEIEDILDKKPYEVSGGAKQRVSLGRALVRPADVYLLDEPISHLDFRHRVLMCAEFKRLHREKKWTMMYITHDQLEAMELADRIAVMNQGIIQQVGTPEEIFNHPSNIFVADFIGEPPMNLLDCEIKTENDEPHICLTSISIAIPKPVKEIISKTNKVSTNFKGYVQFTLGIRPMHIDVLDRQEKESLKGNVEVYENLGSDSIITISIDPHIEPIQVMTDANKIFQSGQPVWLRFRNEKIHVFNSNTGDNLVYGT